MLKNSLGALLLIFIATSSFAQDKYWVYFKDKPNAGLDPCNYFDSKAIERRKRLKRNLTEYTDLPVNTAYIAAVSAVVDSVGYSSRWLNAVAVWADTYKITEISALPYVASIERIGYLPIATASYAIDNGELSGNDMELLELQTQMLEAEKFTKAGLNGKGVRIAVLDVGFENANEHPAFTHLFSSGRIVDTYDFIKKRQDVYAKGLHGTMVLSCLAGMYDSIPQGLATGAEFLLARTERTVTEFGEEEDAWIAAVEWAEQKGADIISSSLGYTFNRYFYHDMNGRTSAVARTAVIAARKGVLIVTAAGNEGNSAWKYVATPGDADSVLTVGGIEPFTGYHAGFSSYGPTADGRLKPNVSAAGVAVVANNKDYEDALGTSFATPLVAGFAACVMQMHPEMSNMDILQEIERSSDLYPYFDYAHGYGIPQASYFTDTVAETVRPTFDLSEIDEFYVISPEDVCDSTCNSYLYYHIADSNNKLTEYHLFKVDQEDNVKISIYDVPRSGKLRIHYLGYTLTLNDDDE